MSYRVNIEESINKILITPKGSRVMRPDYGSKVLELIDRRFSDELAVDLIMEVYESLNKNEKRIFIKKITPKIEKNEKIKLEIEYQNKENNESRVMNFYVK